MTVTLKLQTKEAKAILGTKISCLRKMRSSQILVRAGAKPGSTLTLGVSPPGQLTQSPGSTSAHRAGPPGDGKRGSGMTNKRTSSQIPVKAGAEPGSTLTLGVGPPGQLPQSPGSTPARKAGPPGDTEGSRKAKKDERLATEVQVSPCLSFMLQAPPSARLVPPARRPAHRPDRHRLVVSLRRPAQHEQKVGDTDQTAKGRRGAHAAPVLVQTTRRSSGRCEVTLEGAYCAPSLAARSGGIRNKRFRFLQ